MSAPSSSGRCSTGVAKTLSTTTCAPAAWAMSQTARTSTISCMGLDGDSKNTAAAGRRQRLLPLRRVGSVDELRGDAPPRQDLVEDDEARPEQAPSPPPPGHPPPAAHRGGEHRRHAGGRGEARLRPLQQPQPLGEHLDGRVAVARVDEAVDVAGERRLRVGRGRVHVARGQVQGLRGLVEPRAAETPAHGDGVGAPESTHPRALQRSPVTTAARAAPPPATRSPPRWSSGSRSPSKPSSTLNDGPRPAAVAALAAAIDRTPDRQRNTSGRLAPASNPARSPRARRGARPRSQGSARRRGTSATGR